MKKEYFILIESIFLFFFSISLAQTYTEIFEGGWGRAKSSVKPAFIDLDNDGLLDLIIGEYLGNLIRYEQETMNSTHFGRVSEIIHELELEKSTAPSFTDLDNDGLLDMIVGTQRGYLLHYEQDSMYSGGFTLISDRFNDIYDDNRSIPIFTDLDNNDLLDMLIGQQDGTIIYYEQDSVSSTSFSLITANFCGIDIGKWCVPTMTNLDGDDLLDLIIGTNSGDLFYYEQDAEYSRNFVFVADSLGGINSVLHAAPVFKDLDNDGLLDMILGETSGSLIHYEQDAAGSTDFLLITNNLITGIIDAGSSAVPCFADLDHDGLLDMIVGNYMDHIHHYEQNANGSNTFSLITDDFNGIWVGIYSSPVITDLGNNDLLDLIIGSTDGQIYYYEQNTQNSYDFSLISNKFNAIDVGAHSEPALTDLDNDGLLDMIIGEMNGTLIHYEQDAAGSTAFTMISDSMSGIYIDDWVKPCFTDLDNDGLKDMLIGYREGLLYHYEQSASGSNDFTLITDNFNELSVGELSKPIFADINEDGLEDLLVGDTDGGVHYFQRDGGTGIEQNADVVLQSKSFQLMQNYPNPFNPITYIRYNLNNSSKVTLKIYNLSGQEIETLVEGFQKAGEQEVIWKPKGLSSGIYFCRLQADGILKTKKLILQK